MCFGNYNFTAPGSDSRLYTSYLGTYIATQILQVAVAFISHCLIFS